MTTAPTQAGEPASPNFRVQNGRTRLKVEQLASLLGQAEKSVQDIVESDNSVSHVKMSWGVWALLRAKIIDVIESKCEADAALAASEARDVGVSEETEAVIACLGDDAAMLRDADQYEEVAANMERAAELLATRASEPAAIFVLRALMAAGHISQEKVDEAFAIAAATPGVEAAPVAVGDASTINQPEEMAQALDPATHHLVRSFARVLAGKLLAAQVKYDYGNSWLADDWEEKCRADLVKHVAKGDPLDVAAYCAFMWHHNWSTATPDASDGTKKRIQGLMIKWINVPTGAPAKAVWDEIDAALTAALASQAVSQSAPVVALEPTHIRAINDAIGVMTENARVLHECHTDEEGSWGSDADAWSAYARETRIIEDLSDILASQAVPVTQDAQQLLGEQAGWCYPSRGRTRFADFGDTIQKEIVDVMRPVYYAVPDAAKGEPT